MKEFQNNDNHNQKEINQINDNQIKYNKKSLKNHQNPTIPKGNSEIHESGQKKIDSIQNFTLSEILKEPFRFKIMFLLYNFTQMNFTEIQKILATTSGNLMYHMKKLEAVQWVDEIVIFSPRVLKCYRITSLGEKQFDVQIKDLKTLLNSF